LVSLSKDENKAHAISCETGFLLNQIEFNVISFALTQAMVSMHINYIMNFTKVRNTL